MRPPSNSGPITVLSCRQCGRALVERDGDTDEITVHGEVSEAPPKAHPMLQVNRYEVTCPACGAVTEYDGPWPASRTGGPSAGTGGCA